MDLMLTEPEAELLRELLDADVDRLIMEIANTDGRAAKKDLREREALLEGILDRIKRRVRAAS